MLPVVRLPDMLPERLRGGVVAIGNFDGVHRGHQAVLAQARVHAKVSGAPLLALTFEPHPREFFQPELAPWPIFPLAERLRLLSAEGVQAVLLQRFDAEFAAMRAESFAKELLAETIGAGMVVTGAGFIFGYQRQGSAAHLRQWLAQKGVGYDACDASIDQASPVSSTRIRAHLAQGDMGSAARLLGRPYTTTGMVLHGEKIGRTLGYPTANIALTPRRAPAQGIYIAWGRVGVEDWWPAVLSFGTRPTFDHGPPLVEAYRLDAPQNYSIYDRELELAWGPHLRAEEKFDAIPALVTQMESDAAQARAFHAQYPTPQSWLDHAAMKEARP